MALFKSSILKPGFLSGFFLFRKKFFIPFVTFTFVEPKKSKHKMSSKKSIILHLLIIVTLALLFNLSLFAYLYYRTDNLFKNQLN